MSVRVKNTILIMVFAALLLGGVCALESYTSNPLQPSPFAADAFTSASGVDLTDWNPLINFSHNAFHAWRIDALLLPWFLPEQLSSATQLRIALLASLLIFFLGSTLLLYSIQSKKDLPFACATTLLLSLLLIMLYGFDTTLLLGLAWLPWAIFLLERTTRTGSDTKILLIFALFVGLRIARSANQ
ncbi:hypothetical protein OAO01_04440, partial [Oligoflexia bacterium]|nr:hypothetical protein [Oligoflexia bacterium]